MTIRLKTVERIASHWIRQRSLPSHIITARNPPGRNKPIPQSRPSAPSVAPQKQAGQNGDNPLCRTSDVMAATCAGRQPAGLGESDQNHIHAARARNADRRDQAGLIDHPSGGLIPFLKHLPIRATVIMDVSCWFTRQIAALDIITPPGVIGNTCPLCILTRPSFGLPKSGYFLVICASSLPINEPIGSDEYGQ